MTTTVAPNTSTGGSSANIYNTSTGQMGFQVAGAPIPAGWSSTPQGVTGTLPNKVNGQPMSTPVVTSQGAQEDFGAKLAAFNTIQENNKLQAQTRANNQALADQSKKEQDALALAQKNIDTQNAQKQQEINAKASALGGASTTPQTNQTPQTGTTQTGTTAGTPTTGGIPQTPTNIPDNTAIQTGINNATNTLLSGQDIIQQQKDQLTYQTSSQLNSLMNGTFPLSISQQSLINSVQTQLQQNQQSQQIANQSYVGQVTEATFRSGGEYTNAQMSGQIANAVSYGVAKIAELDNNAAKTMAELQNNFQKQDYELITKNYDILNSQLESKSKELQDTYNTVTKQLTDQRNYNLDIAKFAQTQDQNAFDRAFKTEQQVFDEKYKSATLAIERQKLANTMGSSPTGVEGQVSMTSKNTPSSADQQAFLTNIASKYGAATAQLVKGISNYTINPNSISARSTSGLNRALIVSLAQQYDPTFNQANFNSRQALITNFTSGKYSQNINSLNTAVGHIADVLSNTEKLGNVGFTPANQAKNTLESLFGAGGVKSASLNISAATSELASVFKGTGATDQEIKALGSIDANSSPDQVKSYIETATQLLSSRLQALDDTYTSGMGKSPANSFLSPTSQQMLLDLKSKGLNIQVPELDKSPIVQIKTFHDASPANAKIYDDLIAQFPQATPDEIAQVLNLQ